VLVTVVAKLRRLEKESSDFIDNRGWLHPLTSTVGGAALKRYPRL